MESSRTKRCEWIMCSQSVTYFTHTYSSIYDATSQSWRAFSLWPAQVATLGTMMSARKLVILKARQLGITWLSLAYALWLLLFRAPATVLLFSLREAEAVELLWRLKGMYERLPEWLQTERVTLSNGRAGCSGMGRGRWPFRPRAGGRIRARWRWWMRPTLCRI